MSSSKGPVVDSVSQPGGRNAGLTAFKAKGTEVWSPQRLWALGCSSGNSAASGWPFLHGSTNLLHHIQCRAPCAWSIWAMARNSTTDRLRMSQCDSPSSESLRIRHKNCTGPKNLVRQMDSTFYLTSKQSVKMPTELKT